MTVTVDASVWVSARFESEPGYSDSIEFLRRLLSGRESVVLPWLAWVETVAAVARKTASESLAQEAGSHLRHLVVVKWVDLDEQAADDAAQLAAMCRLRAADAVYAAVARRHEGTLVTLDQELRTRCGALLQCQLPIEWAPSEVE